jgi:hypothetical protein
MSGTSAWLTDHVASLLPKPVAGFLPQATAGACVGESTWESNAHECTGQTCCYWIDLCHYSCHGRPICEKLTSTVVCE